MAVLNVPVTKGKGTVEIDTDKIPEDVFAEAMLQGLKVLVNRGTSKITKESYPQEDELKTAAMAKAAEQVELIMTSKIKFTGQKKAAGVSGAVKTEAMRLARNLVKDEMKRAGIKVSHVKSAEITAAAKELLDAEIGKTLIETAKANLEARSQVDLSSVIKIKDLVHEDAGLVAKAAERKAKSGTLSAKQAGKVKTRAKGEGARAEA